MKRIAIQRGQVLLGVTVFFMAFSLSLVLGFAGPVLRDLQTVNELQLSRQSYFASESLAEDIAYRLKNSMQTQSQETLTVGGATASATLSLSGSGNTIMSTGSDDNLLRAVKITLTAGTGAAFNYGVEAGQGGFVLDGGSTINGNVYSDGTVEALNGVHINGSAAAADLPSLGANQSNNTPSLPPDSITFGNGNSTQAAAQSFQVSTDGALTSVDVYIKKNGSPGNITVHLTTDASGSPASSDLVNTTLSSSQITSTYGWVTVTFPTYIHVLPGVTYWLVLDAGNGNANKNYVWGANTSYSNGTAKTGQYGASWSDTSTDGYFDIYLGGATSYIGGDTSQGGVYISSNTWANQVVGATVSGTMYCQTSRYTNKFCNTSQSDPAQEPMPLSDSDITTWENQGSAGQVISGNYTVGASGATLGPAEITGNLTVEGGGKLTLTGTLWVKGSVDVTGGAKVVLDPSYGSNSGVLVTDGVVELNGGSTLSGSGQSGSYLMVVTTSDCPFDSSCAGAPAITLSGGANSVILIAQNGDMTLDGGSTIEQATAYELTVTGGATLNYDSGLINSFFTNGPSGGFQINSWKEQAP